MKKLFLVGFISCIGFFAYQQISLAAAVPPCPCDTRMVDLTSGPTGNEIIDMVCPRGELAQGNTFLFEVDRVQVSTFAPFKRYEILSRLGPGEGLFCEIFADNVGNSIPLTEVEYESCRQRVIRGCNLKLLRPIPTLSQWGLIAMAGIIGLAGFIAVRKKYSVN